MGRQAWFERIGSGDLTELATDVGPVPMNVGAALLLGAVADDQIDYLVATLAARLTEIPRLSQVLVDPPPGLGRPIWVDDPGFDVARHLERVRCGAPAGDTDALLAIATAAVVRPFDRSRPLWRALVVTGLEDGAIGLVVAFHHVLADGIGGLAVLAELVDGPGQKPGPIMVSSAGRRPASAGQRQPRPAPTRRELLRDALSDRARSIGHLPWAVARLWSARAELGTGRGSRAPRTSLNTATGDRRRVKVVHIPLVSVQEVARAHGATVNDVMLAAVTGALHTLLVARGEHLSSLVVSVPVAARPATTTNDLGNRTGVMPVTVPISHASLPDRLVHIAAVTRAQKTQDRGASMAVVGPAFRLAAALGVFRWMIERQRLVNTFLTNLVGPAEPVSLATIPVRRIVPITITAGNVTVAFAVLSYAGELTITVIADPDAAPDIDVLVSALETELAPMAQQ